MPIILVRWRLTQSDDNFDTSPFSVSPSPNKRKTRAGKMAQIKLLICRPDNLNLIPGTQEMVEGEQT